MSDERRQRIEALFEEALDVPADARADWLADACGEDVELREEVGSLLAAHDLADGILEVEFGEADRSAGQERGPERRIGPYRIIRELGRGGMGVVYLAERDDGQFRRRVAVKLLRSSPDADELHQRFVAERQILASLDHPNIAQLLDGGVTDGRLPYLVMEFADGLPITRYCDRYRLNVAARLRLFQDVCHAVHHAHRNLIIHRDLKPSNIVVTESGQVKLLDFGIAKLLNPGLSAVAQPVTRTELRVMTPEYASPEQVRGEPLSTASDVYSLGVVLYELLTGRRPYRLGTRSPQEIADAVLERDPERPSTIVTRTEAAEDGGAEKELTPTAVGMARDTSPERLRRILRGDLDAIVMMALRKEPNRRYGSANLLAEDIQRYLGGLPVLAHKGSRWYITQKFLRRNWGTAVAAGLVLVSVMVGAGGAAWQARLAREERDRAEAARAEAERALRQSGEVTDFLIGLFEASDPATSGGDQVTARDLLERGVRRTANLTGQPLVQARMLDVMGQVYRSLGLYTEARDLLERALALRQAEVGEQHVDVAQTLTGLAEVLRMQGQYPEAEASARRALEIQERLLGPDHEVLAPTLIQLSGLVVYRGDLQGAETLARRALAVTEAAQGTEGPLMVRSLILLGSVLRRHGRYEDAEQSFRRALAITQRTQGPNHIDSVEPMLHIAYLLADEFHRLNEAERLFRQAVEIRRRTLGENHVSVAYIYGNLSNVLARKGEFDRAVAMARQQTDILRRVLGAEHPAVGAAISTEATALHRAGRHEEAEATFRESVEAIRRTLGEDHQSYGGAMATLARFLSDRGRYEEAESLFRRAIENRTRASGGEVPVVATIMGSLAEMLVAIGRYDEAESLLVRGVEIMHAHGVLDGHSDVQTLYRGLVTLYEATGRADDAARYRSRLIDG